MFKWSKILYWNTEKNILRNPYAILVERGGGGGAIHPLNILCLMYCWVNWLKLYTIGFRNIEMQNIGYNKSNQGFFLWVNTPSGIKIRSLDPLIRISTIVATYSFLNSCFKIANKCIMYNGGLLIETRTPTVVTVSEMHAYITCLFTNKCTVDMWWEILI